MKKKMCGKVGIRDKNSQNIFLLIAKALNQYKTYPASTNAGYRLKIIPISETLLDWFIASSFSFKFVNGQWGSNSGIPSHYSTD